MTDDTSSENAMAAMGLPSNFAAPAFPKEKGAARPPPPGPSSRSGRGRDGGWGDRGRGRGAHQQMSLQTGKHMHSMSAPIRGRGFVRGGHQANNHSNRGNNFNSNRNRGGHTMQPIHDGPLPPLEEIPPLFRPSFIEEDPWSHLS